MQKAIIRAGCTENKPSNHPSPCTALIRRSGTAMSTKTQESYKMNIADHIRPLDPVNALGKGGRNSSTQHSTIFLPDIQ